MYKYKGQKENAFGQTEVWYLYEKTTRKLNHLQLERTKIIGRENYSDTQRG